MQCIVIKCIKWFLANGQLRCVHSAVCRPVQCDKSSNIIHHHQLRPAPRDFADQDSLQTFHITSSTSSSSPISRHASVSSTYPGAYNRPDPHITALIQNITALIHCGYRRYYLNQGRQLSSALVGKGGWPAVLG